MPEPKPPAAVHPAPLAIGADAPDFDLPAVNQRTAGARVRLQDVTTKLFVFVQGCNHCPYVLANVDRLTALAHAYELDATFVMVNSNDAAAYPDDAPDAMARFAEEHDLPFAYLFDEDQRVAMAYRTFRTPEVLVFDEHRRLAYHGRIDDSPKDPAGVTRSELRDALDALLAGRAPDEPETWAVGCTVKWKPGNFPEPDTERA
ncbi:MAG: thioredoxin family protein [Trueperaceae bacterium]